jgi:hypothetical protein
VRLIPFNTLTQVRLLWPKELICGSECPHSERRVFTEPFRLCPDCGPLPGVYCSGGHAHWSQKQERHNYGGPSDSAPTRSPKCWRCNTNLGSMFFGDFFSLCTPVYKKREGEREMGRRLTLCSSQSVFRINFVCVWVASPRGRIVVLTEGCICENSAEVDSNHSGNLDWLIVNCNSIQKVFMRHKLRKFRK